MQLFHATTPEAAEAILRDGFKDARGSYMFADFELEGVFVGNRPVDTQDGAAGDFVLVIEMPDDLDISYWAIVEEGLPQWEFCIPAAVLNEHGRTSPYDFDDSELLVDPEDRR